MNTKHPVNQYDKEGKYLKTFKTLEQAAIDLMIAKRYIHRSCSTPLTKADGFYFRYWLLLSGHSDLTPIRMRDPKL